MKWSGSSPVDTSLNPGEIQRIFTEITSRYDFLNSWLSFRLDRLWRNGTAEAVVDGNEESILDIGTGTGRLLETLMRRHPFRRAVGVDLCESMLAKAREVLKGKASLALADVSRTAPFLNESFDLVCSSFTLRSLPDLSVFFMECARILKRGGRIALLELTRPQNRLIRLGHRFYMKFYVPLIGRIFSRSRRAYQFLADSVLRFEDPARIASLLSESGFGGIRILPYHGGIATLVTGVRL